MLAIRKSADTRPAGPIDPGRCIRAGFIRGNRPPIELAETLGLADGFAAGTTRLAYLPEEGPKDQVKVPATIAGVLFFLLLGKTPAGDPGSKEGPRTERG